MTINGEVLMRRKDKKKGLELTALILKVLEALLALLDTILSLFR